MVELLTALRAGPLLAEGAMGSLLFERTGRLSESNHVYEFFNLERPELIEEIHLAYLTAGARCLKTNTFGANRQALKTFGLEQQTAAINRAGVERARTAIARFRPEEPVFVLASVGPCESGADREQLDALLEAGPDALLLETFASAEELERALDVVQSYTSLPPLIAEVTNAPDPAGFLLRMQQRGVPVAGVNCCAPWDAEGFVEAVKDLPAVRDGTLLLSVMPNAGGFQRIGRRFMSCVNPEYVGKLARRLANYGVRLIGGCCEMHPQHIREMHNYLRSCRGARVAVVGSVPRAPAGMAEKRGNGPFSRKLMDRQFVVSVELLPPRGTDPKVLDAKVEFVRQLAASGLADAVDVTDGSRGIPLMLPGDFIHLLRRRLGDHIPLEFIAHFTGRDLNLMGIQSRLIGYHANGIHNVLFITGDPPKMSPTYPRSTAVFDLDSITMIRLTHACLNAGVDFGGAPLGRHADPRTHFTIGSGFEPEAINRERELDRLRAKLENGADYIMTQPAFRHEPLAVLEEFRGGTCRFLVGVMVLANLEHARRMAEVPGVVLPAAILQRLAHYERQDDQAKAAREIAVEQIRRVRRDGWDGLYLMSPGGIGGVIEVLQEGLQA
ncbi:MAG: homocysteine S-methyltransferase family protein [Verrucomicrobiae bacterium]|nr:homocysteine S-methyltransferase family protein [Verrucomicrobiae bacterium]